MMQYWLVTATWTSGDVLAKFIDPKPTRNYPYWELEPSVGEENPGLSGLRRQMRKGDRIAVKGTPKGGRIAIRALGIVKRLAKTNSSVYVKWLKGAPVKTVEWNGCSDAIEGPFPSPVWLAEIFSV